MKVVVEVTAEDIANGIQEDATACPIYLAALRAGIRVSSVGETRMKLVGGTRVSLPASARDFIERYDEGRLVDCKPFAFELEIP